MRRCITSLFLFIFLLPGYLFPQNTNIKIEGNFGMATQIFWMTGHGNKIVTIGFNTENNKNYGFDAVFLFDGQEWKTIPRFYEIGPGIIDTLWVWREPGAPLYISPEFDPEGNLWIPGRYGFYKYSNGSLIKYSITDSGEAQDNYFYSHIRFDSLGKIVLLRTKILSKKGIGPDGGGPYVVEARSQLINFDGKNYQVIDSGSWGTSGIIELDVSPDLIVTKKGKLVANKVIYVGNNIWSKLLIRSPNGELEEIIDLPTPPYLKDSTKFRLGIAVASKIFEDSDDNIWIGLLSGSGGERAVGGLLKWERKSNKWKAFYGNNGYPVFPSQLGPSIYTDSLYIECYGIAQDKSGRIWVGGRTFLGVIDENEKIKPPDFILDNLVLYPRFVSDEKQKPEFDSFLRDSLLQFLYNLTHKQFLPWTWVSAIGPPTVEGITTTEDGSIWFAINGLGMLRYNPNINSNPSDATTFEDDVSILPSTIARSNPYFKVVFSKSVETANIRIYDLNTRLVATKNFLSLTPMNEFEVNLSNEQISSGTYFVMIGLKDKIIFKKIIVY